jgi:hypothetical protein
MSAAMRAAPLLLWIALTPACRTWRPEPLPASPTAERVIRHRVRATRADGRRLELTRVRVARDTLRGELRAADGGPGAVVAVPVDSLRRLETRRVNVARTVGLYFGVMGVVFLGMTAAESSTYGPR